MYVGGDGRLFVLGGVRLFGALTGRSLDGAADASRPPTLQSSTDRRRAEGAD